jgi:hypothetical protein
VTPKTQTLTAGGKVADHSPASSGGGSATRQDSPAPTEHASAAGGLQAETAGGDVEAETAASPAAAPAQPDGTAGGCQAACSPLVDAGSGAPPEKPADAAVPTAPSAGTPATRAAKPEGRHRTAVNSCTRKDWLQALVVACCWQAERSCTVITEQSTT